MKQKPWQRLKSDMSVNRISLLLLIVSLVYLLVCFISPYLPLLNTGSASVAGLGVTLPGWACMVISFILVALGWVAFVFIRKPVAPLAEKSEDFVFTAPLGFLASFLLPAVPLVYLYGRNATELDVWQVALLAALLCAITGCGYFIALRVTKNKAVGLFNALFMTIVFFAFGPLFRPVCRKVGEVLYGYGVLPGVSRGVTNMLAALGAVLITGLLYMRFVKKRSNFVACFIGLLCGLLLLMNIMPFGENLQIFVNNENNIKTTFSVDENTKTPNVYWFLCDGMMNFESMEKYYDEPQSELKEQLLDRGFFINPDAGFEAGHVTTCCIPTLMCPDFYSNVISKYMGTATNVEAYSRALQPEFQRRLAEAREHNELVAAFQTKGYTTCTIGLENKTYFFQTTDRYYESNCAEAYAGYLPAQPATTAQSYLDNLLELLKFDFLRPRTIHILSRIFLDVEQHDRISCTTTLSDEMVEDYLGSTLYRENNPEITYHKCKQMIRYLYDALDIDSPRFVIMHDLVAHRPFTVQLDVPRYSSDPEDIRNYPAQHRYAGQLLIAMCDMILEKDPDAVIVFQADHGIHRNQCIEQMQALYGEDVPLEDFFNSTFSCVRIPDSLKDGSEEQVFENPLNISRYLVNRFVGDNYAYLP